MVGLRLQPPWQSVESESSTLKLATNLSSGELNLTDAADLRVYENKNLGIRQNVPITHYSHVSFS